MQTCTSCGAPNPAEFRFCGRCGVALGSGACPACGFANPAGQHFCGRCGGGLDAPEPEALDPAERRFATVLFADVVGFTALAEASDPEALASTVDAALRRMSDIVVAHGGTVDKYIGDALMALFGVPFAHGDDAERAVAAALQMRDAGGDLHFSIGVNSGDVMVTAIAGGGVTVIGDTVNVASRLQGAAGTDEVLIGPMTAELVNDRFHLRERAPTMLRGKREPVAVFEVVRVHDGDGEASESQTTLVGRDAELAFVRSRWQRAAERSRAQVVVLTGEAGVGKSRLAAEVAARVVDESVVVRARCPGYGALVGSRLALELSTQLGGESPDDGGTESASGLDERGVWRLRGLIAARAAERPVLIVIDDLHNATPADLDPVVQLTGRIAELPVTMLLAGRPQPADWLSRFPGASTLHLDPLSPGDASRLAMMLAEPLALDSDAANGVAALSGGNPLHLRELMRLLATGGQAPAAARPALPPTLQGVLAARLDSLPPADKVVVQDVSIFSDGATAEEVSALTGAPVQPALDRLTGAGLLRRVDTRYEVGDPLLREVAYEQVSHAARARRHRLAASVAATPMGRARHLGLAAQFLPHDVELRAEAAAELAQTGLELLHDGRYRDGARLVRRALELGHAEPRTLLRLAEAENDMGRGAHSSLQLLDRIDAAGDGRLEAEVLQARGNAIRPSDPPGSVALLTEAANRWQALGDPGKRAWALANTGMTLFDMGRLGEAADAHSAALEIFISLGDRVGAAAAGQTLALERPDDPRVPQWLTDGLRLAEETGDLAKQRNALIPLSWFHFIRAHLGGDEVADEARTSAEGLVRVSAEIGDATFEVQGQCLLAVIDRFAGRLDAAEQRVARARRVIAGESSYSQALLDGVDFMLRLIRGADPATRPAPAVTPRPIGFIADALIVEGLLLAGHADAAMEHGAASGLDALTAVSPTFGRLMGLIRGGALVIAGRGDEALDVLHAALETARVMDARPAEVASSALLAEVALQHGDRETARSLMRKCPEDPGGIAGLLRERALCLLGESDGASVDARCAWLHAPGLAIRRAGVPAA